MKVILYELLSKLLVSPLITPYCSALYNPLYNPLYRSLTYSSYRDNGTEDFWAALYTCSSSTSTLTVMRPPFRV